ncbi:stalk domain-containing protein [Solibacillus daqui]
MPLRGIFEVLGAEVLWEQSSKTINASKNDEKIFC